ncbi:MAG: hypothetical protein M0Q14_03035 [Tissierellaceae bacterium]|nr:hypothetical protein [Tissierellaceae bacterium]
MKRKNILIILLLILILALVGCETEEYKTHTFNYDYYEEENFFTFEYPESWEIVEDDASEFNKFPEKSPDFGLKIYMDNEKKDINFISIFEGVSSSLYIYDENLSKEEFLIDGEKKGYIYSNTFLLKEYDTVSKIITYEADDENHAWRYVMISSEKEFYDKNKKKIERVLKSIEF